MPPLKKSLEQRWRLRASTLRPRQWQTDTWYDLVEAVEMRDEGDLEGIREWFQETLRTFERLLARCQEQAQSPPNNEADLAQLFLHEGAEAWLRALTMLRAAQPAEVVLDQAQQGQRLLITVQILEATLLSR